jgi:hypothetical protein
MCDAAKQRDPLFIVATANGNASTDMGVIGKSRTMSHTFHKIQHHLGQLMCINNTKTSTTRIHQRRVQEMATEELRHCYKYVPTDNKEAVIQSEWQHHAFDERVYEFLIMIVPLRT